MDWEKKRRRLCKVIKIHERFESLGNLLVPRQQLPSRQAVVTL